MTYILQTGLGYLSANFLLVLGYGLFRLLMLMSDPRRMPKFYSRLAIWFLGLALALPVMISFLPPAQFFNPRVQVFSEIVGKSRSGSIVSLNLNADSQGALTSQLSAHSERLEKILWIWILIVLVKVAYLGVRLVKLKRDLRTLPRIRRYRNVEVLASDKFSVAFSSWLFGSAYVVVPMALISLPTELQITIRHELQHHRQGDTRFLYVLELLECIFFINPAIFAWSSIISSFQEFACDEFLVLKRSISPQAYGRCLVSAAELAVGIPVLVGTTSMASSSCKTLQRRIEMLRRYQKEKSRNLAFVLLAIGTSVLLGGAAFAARGNVHDRFLNLTQAKALAFKANQDTEIPIEVTPAVLARLNAYVGTADGRNFLHAAFARLPLYQTMIKTKLKRYGLPPELVAIAMMESGFNNKIVSPGAHARGIWQFIAGTAQRYHLTVTDQLDERTNAVKETESAMQYFTDLKGQFHDWRLAIKAYNEGEQAVQKLIDDNGTEDPWALEAIHSNEGYLPNAIAAILIYKNPSLVN